MNNQSKNHNQRLGAIIPIHHNVCGVCCKLWSARNTGNREQLTNIDLACKDDPQLHASKRTLAVLCDTMLEWDPDVVIVENSCSLNFTVLQQWVKTYRPHCDSILIKLNAAGFKGKTDRVHIKLLTHCGACPQTSLLLGFSYYHSGCLHLFLVSRWGHT